MKSWGPVDGHKLLRAPVPVPVLGSPARASPARAQRPAAKPVHSHLLAWALVPGPVLPAAQAWIKSHRLPVLPVRTGSSGVPRGLLPGSQLYCWGEGGYRCSHAPQVGVEGWVPSGRKLVVSLTLLLIKGLHT